MKHLFLVMGLVFAMLNANEEFDTFESFEDEESSFVIKTKKPKIIVKKDSKAQSGAVKFLKESRGENSAITMSVKNFLLFSKLKGINARYLVIDLELKNILKSQKVIVSNGSNHPASWVNKSSDDYEYTEAIPLYRIPDMMKHLYLRVNGSEEKGIDIMSLLLDRPLIDHNSNQIDVPAKLSKEGQLVFRLPKGKKIEQLSLHYYDTKYGNIDIALVGELKEKIADVTTLPTKPWEKMNDNFSLTVTGYDVKDNIGVNQAKKDGQFEIVEIDIESKVYALLQFDPSKRFYLNIGDRHSIKLHPITQALPMGLYTAASLSPGSNNKFRLAFYVPKGLEKESRSLMVELKGKDITIPIKKGEDTPKPKVLAKSSVEGTSLEVNGIYTYDKKIVVDMTFDDKADAYSTRLYRAFELNENDIEHSDTIFGFKEREVILNSQKKRVFVWFDRPSTDKIPYELTSGIFTSLKVKIDKQPKPLPDDLKYFLTKDYPYTHQLDSIDKKVLALVKTFKAKKSKEERSENRQHIATLDSLKEESRFTTIDPISASSYGEDILSKMKTVDELIVGLKKLEWVPSAYDVTAAIYSTPAVFTQGWSSENEMFKAVYERVKEYDVKYGSYSLNNEGEKELKKLAKNIPLANEIPFIEWSKEGKKHSMVFPFLQPIDEVENYITDKQYLSTIKQKQATIEMKLTYLPKNDGTATKSFGMFGSALGGGTTTEKTSTIFKKSWNLDEVSDTPVDIYFPSTRAFYEDSNGTHEDKDHALSDKKVEPKLLTITITMPDEKLDTYTHYFKDKQELQDLFFTFALATSDIPKDAIEEMEKARISAIENIDKSKIDPMSILQWSNRVKIYKFISKQTRYEKELERVLKVDAKRNKRARVIMAVIEKTKNNKLISSLDLRRVYNDVYGTQKANNSFNIMSGIFNAQAEKSSLPNGKNISTYWLDRQNTDFVFISLDNKKIVIEEMKKQNIKESIINRLKQSDKIWFYPMKIKQDIGWLEIDPKNYQTNSVYENGMYGVAEQTEMEILINACTDYFIGFFSGVLVSQVSMFDTLVDSKNFCDNVKQAKALASEAACLVGIVGTRNLSAAHSALHGCLGNNKTSKLYAIKGGLSGNKTAAGNVAGAFLGFGTGFGDGVNFYFLMAEKNGNCPK